MTSISSVIFLAILYLVFVFDLPVIASENKAEINLFYNTVIDTLKVERGSMRSLVELVRNNLSVAESCLRAVERMKGSSEEQGEALAILRNELQIAILLSRKPSKCDEAYTNDLLHKSGLIKDEDSRIYCLERLTQLCPLAGEACIILGDLYLKQRRCGMAIEAYQKAINITGDQDSKKLLTEAEECKKDYVRQKPVSPSQVTDLIVHETTMAPTRHTIRKATVGNSIQRQILFDEWSYRIKDQFLPELKIIGETLKESFGRNSTAKLLIEGHTDRRGPYERNMQLSRDRANSIKQHLVTTYGIDPSKLQTEGFGPNRPYSPDENEAGWAMNRRVEFKKFE
jgi:outer membrane protein OmpA-like peptidoglycan-associated protein